MMLSRKRVLLPILISLPIAGYFMANVKLTADMASVSAVFVILFAVPTYWAIIKSNGLKKGLLGLLGIGLYALIIESLAIHTSFPYGNFTYNDTLGSKIFGLTPWTVAFAYPPVLFIAYFIVRNRINKLVPLIFLTGLFAMSIDLVLDPGAVALGFWYWPTGGFFYGVPLVNFLGWILTGSIGAAILIILFGRKKPSIGTAHSGLLIIWFWTWINIWLGQVLPAIIGVVILLVCIKEYRSTDV